MDLDKLRSKDVERIHLEQKTDQLWALVNTVTNLQFPQKAENFHVLILLSLYAM
jgi:hypothetical protein